MNPIPSLLTVANTVIEVICPQCDISFTCRPFARLQRAESEEWHLHAICPQCLREYRTSLTFDGQRVTWLMLKTG